MVVLAGNEAQKLAGYPVDEEDFLIWGSDLDRTIGFAWRLARNEAGLSMTPSHDEAQQDLKSDNPLHPRRIAGIAIIERARAETIALLKDNWQAVVRVAGALSYHNRLTPAELDHIIAHGQRGRR